MLPADEGVMDDDFHGDEEGQEQDLDAPSVDASTSQAQTISTACWLTMKEVAMLVAPQHKWCPCQVKHFPFGGRVLVQ